MKLKSLANNLLAWKGDAALLFFTRSVLIDRYPELPIKYLQARQDCIVSNASLNNYCKRHKLSYGCNVLEIRIGQLISSKPDEAKAIVEDMLKHSILIKRMDAEQMKDGKACPVFLANDKIAHDRRQAKKKFFNAIEHLPLSYRNKHHFYNWINKMYEKLFSK